MLGFARCHRSCRSRVPRIPPLFQTKLHSTLALQLSVFRSVMKSHVMSSFSPPPLLASRRVLSVAVAAALALALLATSSLVLLDSLKALKSQLKPLSLPLSLRRRVSRGPALQTGLLSLSQRVSRRRLRARLRSVPSVPLSDPRLSCPHVRPLGSDAVTYTSTCMLSKTVCQEQRRISVVHSGSCALLQNSYKVRESFGQTKGSLILFTLSTTKCLANI
ncbi:unnamed protein product [Oppiella nova]|uniref:Kazal-like domain-containing protein n=1 Tax=Oppiella nova TaxID=334625 RepID=A0A7R9M5G6_9ACAR|nr:unnamed protein product [Oppiella nova]CAG2169839.1 unnamed protein product [Oppiella nova]